MAFWEKGLLALGAFWILQVIGTWVQMRHYQRVMRDIAARWPQGLLGASATRGYLGKGVIAIVVSSSDEIVRQVFIMEGRSVFAKFKPSLAEEGKTLSALATEVGSSGNSARRKAIAGAVAQIRRTVETNTPRDPIPKAIP